MAAEKVPIKHEAVDDDEGKWVSGYKVDFDDGVRERVGWGFAFHETKVGNAPTGTGARRPAVDQVNARVEDDQQVRRA